PGPARCESIATLLGLGELLLQPVPVTGIGRELDLELHDAAIRLVELVRARVDLDAEPRARLVDEVDRLVGQEAVGDVAVAEHGCGDERSVTNTHAVVRLVALLEA